MEYFVILPEIYIMLYDIHYVKFLTRYLQSHVYWYPIINYVNGTEVVLTSTLPVVG